MFPVYLHFTTYTVAATLLSLIIPFTPFVAQTLRAATAIVAASALYIYARYGPETIYIFNNKILPTFFTNPALTVAYDILVHFGPVLLLGLPTTTAAAPLLTAYAALALWYVAIRPQVQTLYPTGVPTAVYDTWIAAGIPTLLAALYVYNNL